MNIKSALETLGASQDPLVVLNKKTRLRFFRGGLVSSCSNIFRTQLISLEVDEILEDSRAVE